MNTVVQQKLYCVQQKLRKDLKNPSSYSVLFKVREKKKTTTYLFSPCYASVIMEHLVTQCPEEKKKKTRIVGTRYYHM